MTTQPRPRIFLVEDHDVVRLGIEKLLEGRYDLVGSADEVAIAGEMIRERRPDLVLLDVQLPGGGGAAVIDTVRRTNPDVKFLAFTVSTSREDVVRLFRAGVDGYVVKNTDRSQLLDLIDQVLAGGRPVSPQVAGYMLDIDESAADLFGIERLTPREREVVTHIARGYSYKETAIRLEMSVKTVETHIHHIFTKLGVMTRHELTRLAYETHFLEPEGGTERREPPSGTITFLLTDIEGSTALWDSQGDRMAKALGRHDAILRNAVESGGGWFVKSTGDGMLAAFDRAGSALQTAVDAQILLQAEHFEGVGSLWVRMALNTGEADERDGDYFGPAVIQTSAILEVCSGGDVLVSAVTQGILGSLPPGTGLVELLPAQPGKTGVPQILYRVTHPKLRTNPHRR